jgi:hypothetical protein
MAYLQIQSEILKIRNEIVILSQNLYEMLKIRNEIEI